MSDLALFNAVNEGNFDKCRLLINKDHKLLFIENKDGKGVLDIAIEKGYKDIEDLIRSKLMYTLSDSIIEDILNKKVNSEKVRQIK